MESKMPESQTDQSLPMVVYLRGDEGFIEDFTWDAQDAMDYLGIKRSRLTQISGRELRVGRIRRDRYIRPVYRQKDLADYKAWTRSTASHQSSSLAIEQVVERLEGQCEQLENAAVGMYRQSLQEAVQQLLSEIRRLDERQLTQLREQQRWYKNHLLRQPDILFRLKEPLAQLQLSVRRLQERQHQDAGTVQEVLAALHRDIAALVQQQKRLAEDLQRLFQDQVDHILAKVQLEQAKVYNLVDNLVARFDEANEQIKADIREELKEFDLRSHHRPILRRFKRQVPRKSAYGGRHLVKASHSSASIYRSL